ncbi:hypothetical protein B0T17DRAFT_531481 [Bombardia bombarda]|uniref:Uncharacterized protein n=1 Tax=Bombardia bombarda TaxID=252184 RepID=A0AA40C5E7_9PEZI|nr:hypothetical protein B0T17DRAFT_531481 [Bombardia bombarda]
MDSSTNEPDNHPLDDDALCDKAVMGEDTAHQAIKDNIATFQHQVATFDRTKHIFFRRSLRDDGDLKGKVNLLSRASDTIIDGLRCVAAVFLDISATQARSSRESREGFQDLSVAQAQLSRECREGFQELREGLAELRESVAHENADSTSFQRYMKNQSLETAKSDAQIVAMIERSNAARFSRSSLGGIAHCCHSPVFGCALVLVFGWIFSSFSKMLVAFFVGND